MLKELLKGTEASIIELRNRMSRLVPQRALN